MEGPSAGWVLLIWLMSGYSLAIIRESSLHSFPPIFFIMWIHIMVCFNVERVKDLQRLDEIFSRFNDLILKKVHTLPATEHKLLMPVQMLGVEVIW